MRQAAKMPLSPAPHRKTEILNAALSTFAEKGVEATTIDEIRQRCQASVGSIYHHFGTKEGIAAALYGQVLSSYWSQLHASAGAAGNAKQAIYNLVRTHLEWIADQPEEARFLFSRWQAVSETHDQEIRQLSAKHFKKLFAYFKPWFQQGILRFTPMELYGPLLFGPAQEVARLWLEGRIRISPRDFVDELSRAAWFSLATDPTKDC